MGKPFKKELSIIASTVEWAIEQAPTLLSSLLLDTSHKPLYIVGSGGSLSACWYAASLYQRLGGFAKPLTPLELYYVKESVKEANLLFISASGKNTDILFAFNLAIQQEPSKILTMSMKANSPLAQLANGYSLSQSIDYAIPSQKDGFLATNSLVAYFILLCRSFGYEIPVALSNLVTPNYQQEVDSFTAQLSPKHSLIVLYGGWGQAVAYDIESKFTEAALGNVILSDYRNFGHGRHHWFAKREGNSAIVALITPEEEKIAEKTLGLLPASIPKFRITSDLRTPASGIEMLIKSFYLANSFGELQGIDPGKPGVPDFGSKLYHLKYTNIYLAKHSEEELAILRKTSKSALSQLPKDELNSWRKKYSAFKERLNSSKFTAIVFDYDGTLCSEQEKRTGPSETIIDHLIHFLEAGVTVGIASGRGKSIRSDLRRTIPNKYWKNLIIGYYNGAEIGYLENEDVPTTGKEIHKGLQKIYKQLTQIDSLKSKTTITLRPCQLTLEPEQGIDIQSIKKRLQNIVMQEEDLQFLESSHSIDIVVKGQASKLNVINLCKQQANKIDKLGHCLVIGDKGQWPGNDFSMLGTPYSLSVDEVSHDPDSCWNLATVGMRNISATLGYLKKINIIDNYFTIQL